MNESSPFAPTSAATTGTTGFYMKPKASPGIWRILGILIALGNLAVWFGVGALSAPESTGGETDGAYSAGFVAGYAMAGILWPAFIALLFRIGKSFRNSRSTWKVFFFASIFFLVAGLGSLAVKGVQAAQSRTDVASVEFLQRTADSVNADLPMMVDEETELYETTADPAVLTYNYRMVNYLAEELDAVAFQKGLKAEVVPELCATKDSREVFLDQGVTLRFAYFGSDQQPITTFDVTLADCT